MIYFIAVILSVDKHNRRNLIALIFLSLWHTVTVSRDGYTLLFVVCIAFITNQVVSVEGSRWIWSDCVFLYSLSLLYNGVKVYQRIVFNNQTMNSIRPSPIVSRLIFTNAFHTLLHISTLHIPSTTTSLISKTAKHLDSTRSTEKMETSN